MAHYRVGNMDEALGLIEHDDPTVFRQGLDHHLSAAKLLEENLAAAPQSSRTRRELADELTQKSDLETRLGNATGALADCRRGLQLFKELADADPKNLWAQGAVAYAHYCAALPCRALGDLTGAIDELDQSTAIFENLADDDPTDLVLVEQLNHILRLRTELCHECGDLHGAKESARRWAQCAERLCAASPKDEALRADLTLARAASETKAP